MDNLAHSTFMLEGIRFSSMDLEETARYIVLSANSGAGGWVVTPNVDIMRRFALDAAFRDLVAPADLFTPDGSPVVWAARIRGYNIRGRVPGSDLLLKVCEECSKVNLPVALLGGNPGSALSASRILKFRYSNLRVADVACPNFGFDQDELQLRGIDEFVSASEAKVVFVGLGSPKQERLIGRLRTLRPDVWWLGVGVTFSFVAGEIPRAPIWMQKIGLEWMFRLTQEPRRLFRRYIVEDFPFAIRMLLRAVCFRLTYSIRL